MITLADADLRFVSAIVLNVARHFPSQFDFDDLLQAGRLAAVQAALAYDPDNPYGASFRTFAHFRIRGAVLMSVRRRNWTEAWHLEIPDFDETQNGEDLSQFFVDAHPSPLEQLAQSDLARELRLVLDELRNPERFVFVRRHVDGADPRRIARQCHWPVKRVLEVDRSAQAWLQRELRGRGITPQTVCLA